MIYGSRPFLHGVASRQWLDAGSILDGLAPLLIRGRALSSLRTICRSEGRPSSPQQPTARSRTPACHPRPADRQELTYRCAGVSV